MAKERNQGTERDGKSNGSPDKKSPANTPLRAESVPRGFRAPHVRELLARGGFDSNALSTLGPKELVTLVEVARDKKPSSVVIDIFNAVAASSPEKIIALVDILHDYSGSLPILADFLRKVGHQDPFIATQRAQILVLPAKEDGTTRSVSGHILTGITYAAYDGEAPTSTTGYVSGKQAITKIFAAFNPEQLSHPRQTEVRERRSRSLRQTLREIMPEAISLESLTSDASTADSLGSPLLTRNLAVFRDLRAAIDQCQQHLAELLHGGVIPLPGGGSLKVAADPGRQFFGWFEEHLRQNPNAPMGVRVAYQSLKDPDVLLSEQEEAFYISGLVSYQRMHSFIDKQVALSGFMADVAEYEALSQQDPLSQRPDLDRAILSLKERLSSPDREITIAEFSSFLELAGIVGFRRAMNQRVLDTYGNEFEAALRCFDFVSFKDDSWREDAMGDSVPMGRLREHLYGAKIGVSKPDLPAGRKQALLTQKDFRSIMDAQLLKKLLRDPQKLLNARPVAEFRSIVQGVVTAYRKVSVLETELAAYRHTPNGANLFFDPEAVGDSLANWKPTLPIGGEYTVCESRSQGFPNNGAQNLSLIEIAARVVDARKRTTGLLQWDLKQPSRPPYHECTERFALAGLYNPADEEFWRECETKLATMRPATEVEDLLNRATKVCAHPMVEAEALRKWLELSTRYISPGEEARLRKLAEWGGVVIPQLGPNTPELTTLRQELNSFGHHMVYSGGRVGATSGNPRLLVRAASIEDFVGGQREWIADLGYMITFSPTQLRSSLEQLSARYVSLKTLPEDWLSKAKKLCSRNGRELLESAGMGLVDNATFGAVRGLYAGSNALIDREFIEAVERISA